MINAGAMTMLDEYYVTNRWMPFAAAMGFHLFLLMWDPTILKASTYNLAPVIINVKMMDHLPVIEQPKIAPKPVERKIEKKHVKKAHKSGLSLSAKPHPLAITRHPLPPKPLAAPKPFQSKI